MAAALCRAPALLGVVGRDNPAESPQRLPCRPPMEASADAVQAALLSAAEAAMAGLALQGSSDAGNAAAASQQAEWLKEQLLERGRLCIAGWHADCRQQLGRLLAAEQLCPEQVHFEALRQRLQQLLGSPGGQQVPAGGKPAKAVQPEGAEQVQEPEEEQGEQDGQFFMGWLDKSNRHGRWQRRWFVLDAEERRLYYSRSSTQFA